jgi:hypothetical protein
MKITYQSKKYTPEAVLARYVQYHFWNGEFGFCEVGGDRRYDLRQGTVERGELPDDIANAAIEHAKVSQLYVRWPL